MRGLRSLPEGLFACCDGERRCYVHVGLYRQSVRLCRCVAADAPIEYGLTEKAEALFDLAGARS